MRRELGLTKLENEVPVKEFRILNEPVLMSRTISVSGKIFLAAEVAKFDTIGVDCVAAGVNELAAAGARPLQFADSISCARTKADKIKEIEAGVSTACATANIQFSGSEIKELPDIFSYDQYDMTGFMTGILDQSNRQMETVADGDVIIGLSSNGLHNSGYVLARKKLYLTKASMELYYETLGGTLGDMLLAPTKIYTDCMQAVRDSKITIKGCVQVADGGIETAVRALIGDQLGAVVKQKTDTIAPLYQMLHRDGNISEEQMRQTFNMGFGMLLAVSEDRADQVVEVLENSGEQPVFLGLAERGTGEIRYIY